MNKNVKHKRILSILILVIFAIVIFVGSVSDLINNISIRNQGNIVSAYVYDVEYHRRDWHSYVKYNINNIEYTSILSHKSNKGEYISIYYDVNNYEKITTNSQISKSMYITLFFTLMWFLYFVMCLEEIIRKK